MSKFSVSILPDRVKLYSCCSKDEFFQYVVHYRLYDFTKHVLCQTFLENETTFYMYYKKDDIDNLIVHDMFSKICKYDPRIYHVFDIHEDLPGIDHVGIIHRISGYFLKKQIPILYFNTYGHNIILVSEEHVSSALDILKEIAYL
jgi:hypothetical protein